MRSLLEYLLSLEGFAISKLSGEENKDAILTSIETVKPDILLMDVHLPGVDSLALVKDIREDRSIAKTVILMSSGMSMEAETLLAGADGFILKPYMPDELITKLKTMIGININGEKT
jgi:two-component system chemotaxis response regulator CheY